MKERRHLHPRRKGLNVLAVTGCSVTFGVLCALTTCTREDDAAGAAPAVGQTYRAAISGTVRDSGGAPLSEVTVFINRCSGAKPIDLSSLRAVSDASGRYVIDVIWRGAASITVREVRAAHPRLVEGRQSGQWVLTSGDTAAIDFVLREGDRLAGRVRLPLTPMERRAGLSEDTVRYHARVESPEFERSFVTDEGGRFDLTVPPGTYTVRVFTPEIVITDVRTPATDLVVEPSEPDVTPEAQAEAFDALWKSMDRHYSYFELKGIDWNQLRRRYRPNIVTSHSMDDFLRNLAGMLGNLEDMHVWLDTPDGRVSTHKRPFERNWNPSSILADLVTQHDCGPFAKVGTTVDGLGVLIILRQPAAAENNVDETLRELRKLRGAPGFLVDLRGGCTGGDETLARQVASFFCAQDTVYAKSRYRNGPAHDDFGVPRERVLRAGQDSFTKPVICLIGSKCMSSGEALVQMMSALPHVTTLGSTTRGSSGNPKPFELPGLPVQVWYSQWVDLMPDGTPVEDNGIKPDIAVERSPADYREADPTWERALSILRERVRSKGG